MILLSELVVAVRLRSCEVVQSQYRLRIALSDNILFLTFTYCITSRCCFFLDFF